MSNLAPVCRVWRLEAPVSGSKIRDLGLQPSHFPSSAPSNSGGASVISTSNTRDSPGTKPSVARIRTPDTSSQFTINLGCLESVSSGALTRLTLVSGPVC